MARHERSYDKGQAIEATEHLQKLGAAKEAARGVRGRDQLRSSCERADEFIARLCERGAPIGTQTTRLTKLLELYGALDLDAALGEVLKRGAISADSVEHVLEQKARARQAKPTLPVELPDDPRVRGLRITPHELKSYDTLTQSSPSATEDHHG